MIPRYLVVQFLSCFRFRWLLIKVWLLNVEKEQLFPLLCCWFHDRSHRCSRCNLFFWRIRSNSESYIGVVRNVIIIFLFDCIFQWLYLVYQWWDSLYCSWVPFKSNVKHLFVIKLSNSGFIVHTQCNVKQSLKMPSCK